MKKVVIKYNPFTLDTYFTVDGVVPKENSSFNHFKGKRFQEWVEGIPKHLKEEYDTEEFEITFRGTLMDFEDLEEVINRNRVDFLKIELKSEIVKDVKDREKKVEAIFNDIQKGPIEELKSPDILQTFNKAKNREFEIAVVATMSAGKSTLINSLLGKKLMPSKNEACTATIVRIKDNDKNTFTAKILSQEGKLLATYSNITLENMKEFNKDDKVSTVELEGDIPFVQANEMKLVLVDTPGPNNARDKKHKETTYRMLKNASNSAVLYVLNASQLTTNDDASLLSWVTDCMKEGGKQSKDRFIFVVNKLDSFDPNEDSIDNALNNTKKYLEEFGIKDPNIFPVSALTALNIRIFEDITDKRSLRNFGTKIEDFNEVSDFYLENYSNYSHLPARISDVLKNELDNATDDNDKALVHTGVRSVEEAISLYVNKYARTAKIKELVDSFNNKLHDLEAFQKLQEEIKKNEKQKQKIERQIADLQQKISKAEGAKAYKQQIDEIDFSDSLKKQIDSWNMDIKKQLDNLLQYSSRKMPRKEAESVYKELSNKLDNLNLMTKIKIEESIEKNIKGYAESIVKQYIKQYLKGLVSDSNDTGINIDPFSLVQSKISNISFSSYVSEVNETIYEEEKVFVEDTRYLLLPWTWFREGDHWETRIKEVDNFVEYVDMKSLTNSYITEFRTLLKRNSDTSINYANEVTDTIKKYFKNQLDEIDKILSDKLTKLVDANLLNDDLEKELESKKYKKQWLSEINERVNNVINI